MAGHLFSRLLREGTTRVKMQTKPREACLTFQSFPV